MAGCSCHHMPGAILPSAVPAPAWLYRGASLAVPAPAGVRCTCLPHLGQLLRGTQQTHQLCCVAVGLARTQMPDFDIKN